jgi:hypothetical protein
MTAPGLFINFFADKETLEIKASVRKLGGNSTAIHYGSIILNSNEINDDSIKFLDKDYCYYNKCWLLNLSDTEVTDRSSVIICRMKRLKNLDLSNTKVTDECLYKISELLVLRHLYLNNTKITDLSIPYLSSQIELEHLEIKNTLLTEDGINTLKKILKSTTIVYSHADSKLPCELP